MALTQRRVYSIYYYGTLTLPCKRRGERAVEAVAVRVGSGREQETLLFYTCYRLLYILSYKRDLTHSESPKVTKVSASTDRLVIDIS